MLLSESRLRTMTDRQHVLDELLLNRSEKIGRRNTRVDTSLNPVQVRQNIPHSGTLSSVKSLSRHVRSTTIHVVSRPRPRSVSMGVSHRIPSSRAIRGPTELGQHTVSTSTVSGVRIRRMLRTRADTSQRGHRSSSVSHTRAPTDRAVRGQTIEVAQRSSAIQVHLRPSRRHPVPRRRQRRHRVRTLSLVRSPATASGGASISRQRSIYRAHPSSCHEYCATTVPQVTAGNSTQCERGVPCPTPTGQARPNNCTTNVPRNDPGTVFRHPQRSRNGKAPAGTRAPGSPCRTALDQPSCQRRSFF